MKAVCLLPLVSLCATLALAEEKRDAFTELVRPTEALTPEQERAAFHLPPGFEIQLVASEPDLRKPMNMQWDSLGRLWITESREYPFAIKDGTPGRDTVRIFSDFDANGKAKKVEVFADGLNIPTGLYPFRSPDATGKITWKCIVWSIPNIWLMEDTDGDGKADKREPLIGPLGWERDTHGNLSSYRRGADGWLYGTHGFNNESVLRGKDGSSLDIKSGNTWRIRIDGSRVEGNTYGQVNPFGLCWDDRGNLYSADCHSSPIYQLLRGAYYPSFGKPHDGLGYAPDTITHSHGSTAICAPIYITDPAWPAEYKDHMFVGNVQTSRLNQDLIEWHGASSKGKELPDFLSTDDPWFRPVDLSWGPDGALYVADFYNKIIGHYEVPLTHPGRDRERGRLWRIVYRGEKADRKLLPTALPQDVDGLIKELGSTNPTRRTLALNDLCDRIGKPAITPLKAAVAKPTNSFQKLNTVWALHRLGALEDSVLLGAIKDTDPLIRTHAARTAREIPKWSDAVTAAVRGLTKDPDAITQRCAAEALGTHPSMDNVPVILAQLHAVAKDDDHLRHSVRIALRDQLKVMDPANTKMFDSLSPEDRSTLLEILVAVPGENSALFRIAYFERDANSNELLIKQLASLVRYVPLEKLDALLAMAHTRLANHPDPYAVANMLLGVLYKFGERTLKHTDALRAWNVEAIERLLPEKGGANKDTVRLAADLIARLKLTQFAPRLRAVAEDANADADARYNAAVTTLTLEKTIPPIIVTLLTDPVGGGSNREKLAEALGEAKSVEANAVLIGAMKLAPSGLQRASALALISTREGAAALLTACSDGLAPTSLLRDKSLLDRLKALKSPELDAQLDKIIASLPAPNVEMDTLIYNRRTWFDPAKADASRGAEVFAKNCAACHAIDGKGGNIGPQLDGIGGRGASRLFEDILDPSRNVDKAFRLTMVTKKDGSILSGLVRNEEGDELVLADLAGQEAKVAKADIATKKETEASLMPPNFGESVSVEGMNDLMAYLLTKKAAK